ncbi:MAG TPA: methionine--tRNA ligase [Patescibacteria group bacterium]|jgi:methionyl-tRNA synthetase|nr:methionine--tRNA ligase [Patescibacteria group bacterium]
MAEQTESNKFYITTAIDYINGKPHIGHSYEKVAADVLARFHRAQGDDTRFLTGTDEHGAKIEDFAKDSGLPIEQFADQAAAGFKLAWDNLNVSYDRFIRTTDADHIKVVEDLVTKIKDNGFLYEADYEGLYCVGHEAFITEKDLVDGLCPDHKTKPELIKEKNWFFKVSAFTDTIKQKIEADEFVIYPEHSKKEILSMLEEGFNDIAASRPNVKWGIPLPWDAEQTIYVWVDALINYVTGATNADGKNYWPADAHLIGPDIAKFHCIIWPALLLAADLPMPKSVAIHGFLTLNGQKISKSTGNIIDPNEWVAKYGADAVRYFLMREVPFDAHGDVSEEKLRARYEGDLANGLGNLVSRVTTLVEKYLDGMIPRGTVPDQEEIFANIAPLISGYKFHEALAEIWKEVSRANKIVDETKLWELGKTDLDEFARVSKEVLVIIETAARQLLPFIPESAQKILDSVTAEKIVKAEPLFPRIEA